MPHKKRAISLAVLLVLFASGVYADTYQAIRDATVRVTRETGRSQWTLGSGTVVGVDGKYAYVLTNHHIGGAKGSIVWVQFWKGDKMQKRLKGETVRAVMADGVDVALVAIEWRELGYQPRPIPIAKDYDAQPGEVFLTCGCSGGDWPTSLMVHEISETNDKHLYFRPRCAGGRSGSGIFTYDGRQLVGLVAWSGGTKTNHNRDGFDEGDGYGKAMTVNTVWHALENGEEIRQQHRQRFWPGRAQVFPRLRHKMQQPFELPQPGRVPKQWELPESIEAKGKPALEWIREQVTGVKVEVYWVAIAALGVWLFMLLYKPTGEVVKRAADKQFEKVLDEKLAGPDGEKIKERIQDEG